MQNKGTERPYRVTVYPGIVRGPVTAPPSKSLCHRAWILAALARGKSRLVHMGASEDLQCTEAIVRQFGARIWRVDGEIWVEGIAGQAETEKEYGCLDCGESGSSLRFLLPVAAALGISAEFVGQGRLPQRPLAPYFDIFEKQGIAWQAGPDGLPLQIRGRLKPGRYEVEAGQSSQFVSGLLMALPLLAEASELHLKGPGVSRPYVSMTRSMMERFGLSVQELGPGAWRIPGGQGYQAAEYRAEGDYSQAAFWIGVGMLGEGIRIQNLPEDSRQGDAALLKSLRPQGMNLRWEKDELYTMPGRLTGGRVDLTDAPDLAPVLAVLAMRGRGMTELTGAAHLRYKESDRLAVLTGQLGRLGAVLEETADGLRINGTASGRGGGEVLACGDHRMAQALALAAISAKEPVTIHGAQCVAKSWPSFWDELEAAGVQIKREWEDE